jgi:hypothetical protein
MKKLGFLLGKTREIIGFLLKPEIYIVTSSILSPLPSPHAPSAETYPLAEYL